MPDQSHLDDRYFVDATVYNCPFCNRRHVSYSIYDSIKFDWTDKKPCYGYFVQCHSCNKKSMHLTFQELSHYHFGLADGTDRWRFSFVSGVDAGKMLDQAFFYSVPTSFFVLDERVPRILRELLTEAEGSLKSNYLTGASACARKIVYELGVLSKASGESYEDRIKSLKQIHSEVEPTFFDTLLTIQQVTSSKVHENSYDGWEAKHLRIILAALSEVLHEIYVVPALREDRRKAILTLKGELIPPEKAAEPNGKSNA
jgi:hypothetical protein